jgi:hypothetical protein
MREADWLLRDDPQRMLKYLRWRWSRRKIRLFVSESQFPSCTQYYSPSGLRELSRGLEYWVEGRENEIRHNWQLDEFRMLVLASGLIIDLAVIFQDYDWLTARRFVARSTGHDQSGFAALLREIAGNPFRPVPFEPSWRTTDVMLLARGIYVDRAFDRMPILADALQDAGCDNDTVLTHCRDTALMHVRGCWVVDLVLGKS